LPIDHVYIINLKKNRNNKIKSLYQLKRYEILNYTIVEAIDGKDTAYDEEYRFITEKMTKNFMQQNFSRGAFGCILSHLKAIEDAKTKKFKNILILEDDFILVDDFKNKCLDFFTRHTAFEFDLLYFGKKQGLSNSYEKVPLIHHSTRFKTIVDVNADLYIPNYETWGTHALLIHHRLFDPILEFRKNIIAPIDIMLMKLYPDFRIFCLKKDLIIADDTESDILVKKSQWKWNYENFTFLKKKWVRIKKIFIVGSNYHHTHTYIHEMFQKFFVYYYPGIPVEITNDTESLDHQKDCLIFYSPAHFDNQLAFHHNNYYIIHLDVNHYHQIHDHSINQYISNHLSGIDNYLILFCREKIKGMKYFESRHRYITLPWFSSFLYEESNPIFNQIEEFYSVIKEKSYYLYMGSIWECNIDIIKNLLDVLSSLHLTIVIKGRIFNVSEEDKNYVKNHKNVIFIPFYYDKKYDYKNSFQYILKTYKIKGILAIQGSGHFDNYISNRIFESISLGYLILSNNALAKKYFHSIIYHDDLTLLVQQYEKIVNDGPAYITLYKQQYKEYIEKFYGFHTIQRVVTHFNAASLQLEIDTIVQDHFKILFSVKTSPFPPCKGNEDIRKCLRYYQNITVSQCKDLDPFLMERFISNLNYSIFVDSDYPYIEAIRKFCIRAGKTMTVLSNSKLLISQRDYTNRFMKKITNRDTEILDGESYSISIDLFLDYQHDQSFINRFGRIYFDPQIKHLLSESSGYLEKPTIQFYCLLSGQRSGSTFIIDYLQKTMMYHHVLPLSEILNLDNAYLRSYDMTQGIFKSIKHVFHPFQNQEYGPYFAQFVEYAESKLDTQVLLFKYTLNYLNDFDAFMEQFPQILGILKSCKIIFLNRMEMESYVSLQLAQRFGFSHTQYTSVKDDFFKKEQFIQYCRNKHKFESQCFSVLPIHHYLDYQVLQHNENDFINHLHSILQIDPRPPDVPILLPKQNNFDLGQINFL